MKIALAQFNYSYGNEYFFPYSVAAIWSYAKANCKEDLSNVAASFYFKRRNDHEFVEELATHELLCFSSYVWNWELNNYLAREVKKISPSSCIVFGGPQVPDRLDLDECDYSHVDLFVHGEGERPFTDILDLHLNGRLSELLKLSTDKLTVQGLKGTLPRGITFNGEGGMNKWVPHDTPLDISDIPSPYLDGTATDIIMSNPGVKFQPTWETTRGCPYQCTFCDWGSLTLSKLRKFGLQRLSKEVEWFSKHKIGFIFGADANFGILERDLEIADILVQSKNSTGYPEKFRVSYAKNSTQRVLRIAEKLNAYGMDKGITLSVQSMDGDVLNNIKRKNLKIGDLSEFVHEYRSKKIPTYTEVIMGLPGETLETFRSGISMLLESGVHDALSIYNCSILPNAPMNEPSYRATHGIKSMRTPVFLNHSVPDVEGVTEYEEICIQTNTMKLSDYKELYTYAWCIQCFHTLNLTQLISIVLNEHLGVSYDRFYSRLIDYMRSRESRNLNEVYRDVVLQQFERVFAGGSWGFVMKEYADIVWSAEEAAYLRCVDKRNLIYHEIGEFLRTSFSDEILSRGYEASLIDDLVRTQEFIVASWKDHKMKISTTYNVYDAWRSVLEGRRQAMVKGRYKLTNNGAHFGGGRRSFARDVLWYGRKGGKHIYSDLKVTRLD